jgi:hemoglobin-like flavoprotein
MSAAPDGWSPDERFDDFVVIRPLGRGGMGRVFLGHDQALDRPVALKFVSSDQPSASERERFLLEARAIARLAHPNVVAVFRVGETAGRPYLAYELVKGRTFHELAGPLAWQVVLTLATGLARGLEAVHRAGLVHRDIKPANVILSDAGEVKLLDFGLAKGLDDDAPPSRMTDLRAVDLTHTGTLVGTPAYLAPEQWQRGAASPRSDVFAVGLVLHELLVGRSQRAHMSLREISRATVEEDVAPVRRHRPEVPETFAAIVDRCVRRSPEERYASAAELRAELEALHSVFLPRGHHVGPPSVDQVAEDVASSFTRVAPRIAAFSTRLYERLFDAHPRLRALFPESMDAQKEKLGHALKLVVDGLQRPDRLAPAIVDLGRRHLGYGVGAEDLALLGDVLLETLREFDAESWSEGTESGWRRAWSFLHDSMVRGYEIETLGSFVDSTTLDVAPPKTRYLRNDGLTIAWQELSEGPFDILLTHAWLSHVEIAWRHDDLAHFLRRLGRHARVITYDKRGVGMSERGVGVPTLVERVSDARAVLDAANAREVIAFGAFDGAAVSTALAAADDRVRAVVAFGAGGGGRDLAARLTAIDEHWGDALFLEEDAPSRAKDPRFRAWYAEWLRLSASTRDALAALRACALPATKVDVPTVVLHREHERRVTLEDARAFAEATDAKLVTLPGEDHLPFAGGGDDVVKAILDLARDQLLLRT